MRSEKINHLKYFHHRFHYDWHNWFCLFDDISPHPLCVRYKLISVSHRRSPHYYVEYREKDKVGQRSGENWFSFIATNLTRARDFINANIYVSIAKMIERNEKMMENLWCASSSSSLFGLAAMTSLLSPPINIYHSRQSFGTEWMRSFMRIINICFRRISHFTRLMWCARCSARSLVFCKKSTAALESHHARVNEAEEEKRN